MSHATPAMTIATTAPTSALRLGEVANRRTAPDVRDSTCRISL
jgi:hypothetical protein